MAKIEWINIFHISKQDQYQLDIQEIENLNQCILSRQTGQIKNFIIDSTGIRT
ncbi:unnamed protein product [Paramecium octaurelia]|uniref:Uncharacterized protein n=1 Tax=Paramecium octaurelia TaxID=43137 RepID=A0A8S1S3J8_PAROT|nr:unnamed protein product [Paramecium octaurelia]